MNKIQLNDNAFAIITAVAHGHTTSKVVAEHMDVKVAVVTGNLASLKKNGLVSVENGVLSLTKEGKKYAPRSMFAPSETTRKVRTGTKAEIARTIFENRGDKARKNIINELITQAGLSTAGAATYLQNLKRAAGLINSKK